MTPNEPSQRLQETAGATRRGTDETARITQKISSVTDRIMDEVTKVMVGKEDKIELLLASMITEGAHVLLEDVPGLGKSVLANAMAGATGCDFRRMQFTPDLLPADINGIYIFNEQRQEFEFRPGPIFTNFLLADEINRASPKTQSALLEAMAEKTVSVEGTTHEVPKPFIVFATQNPVEQGGTYPLPEAQMDRFMMKMSMGYPSHSEEAEIIRRRMSRGQDDHEVSAVCNAKTIRKMQEGTEKLHVSEEMIEYITGIIVESREHEKVRAGGSPRATLALFKLGRSIAAMEGRDFVTPDDVKRIVPQVLNHRLILEPEASIKDIPKQDIVDEILEAVPVPKV